MNWHTPGGTVTGAVYKSTRPRGFRSWDPQAKNKKLVSDVQAILSEYADYLPLTVRQIFYRLVGTTGYAKTEDAYSSLAEALNRARRARMIDFDDIRDDGTTERPAPGYASPEQCRRTVLHIAKNYSLDRLTGQPRAVEVWVEAAGMVPQVERVAHRYGVPVYSSGGFNSVTAHHETAQRIVKRDRPTAIINIGDHDPSGGAIVDSFADDVMTFCAELGSPGILDVARVAVTPEQIERFSLITSPAKTTDDRGGWSGGTVQVEALDPPVLAAEIKAGLEEVIDLDQLEATDRLSVEQSATLVSELEGLGWAS